MTPHNSIQISLKEFYSITVRQCVDSARSYKSSLESEASSVPVQTSVKLEVYQEEKQVVAGLRDYFLDIVKQFPVHEKKTLDYMHGLLNKETGILDRIKKAATGDDAVKEYGKLRQIKPTLSTKVLQEPSHGEDWSHFTLCGDGDKVVLEFPQDSSTTAYGKRINEAMLSEAKQSAFFAAVMQLLDQLRDRMAAETKSTPSSAEAFAIVLSAMKLQEGNRQPCILKPISLPGRHKKHQSFVFVTDAGPDHIKITVQDRELLDHGIVVHIEHIDRSETGDRSLMEAYRLPSQITAARVRLHVGDLAPTSCFIGRPTFEGLSFNAQYPHDNSGNTFGALAKLYCNTGQDAHDPDYSFNATLLKAAHQTASACSAMFESGIVDAKIAIENMTEQQAIKFMNAIVANVRRDPDRQYLSAAFNINRPIYCESKGRVLKRTDDPAGIYELIDTVVNIAGKGHFDKVTLDGASERKSASIPIVNQLSHRQMLHFVHTAHKTGLITYFSAGIDATNLHKAVYTGVDGLGIGFALHANNPKAAGVVAALSIEEINKVLKKRDEAEESLLGKAGKILAHLDYSSYEGTLTPKQETLQSALFDALNKPTAEEIDEDVVRKLLDESYIPAVAVPDERNKTYSLAAQLLFNEGCALSQHLEVGWQDTIRRMLKGQELSALRNVLAEAHSKWRSVFLHDSRRTTTLRAATPTEPENNDALSLQRLSVLTKKATAPKTLPGVSSQHVSDMHTDLTKIDPSILLETAAGRVFVGVREFPRGVTEADLLRRGAIIVKPGRYLPFRVGRSELYEVQELIDNDENIYKWCKNYHHDTFDNIMMSLHDGVILDLLREQYAGMKQVGVMGGHSMLRDSVEYSEVAFICRSLAKQKFVVATGGGPGAMEAANLGAHFSNYKEEDLRTAIAILKEKPRYVDDLDNSLAQEVLKQWPKRSKYSLGVPTWHYGHEPPNLFCLFQAKFFSNAIREDVLVLTCNCGIIFTPGSAGTRTEIAQFAVQAKYSKEIGSDFAKPMIFYSNFWTENTVYPLYLNLAQRERLGFPRPSLHYSNKLYSVHTREEILSIVNEFYKRYYPYNDIDRGVAPTCDEEAPQPDYTGVPIAERARIPVSDIDVGKKSAAYLAVNDWVARDGMVIGIGSGTTVEFVVDRLAQMVDENKWNGIICVPTSFSSRFLLKKYADVLTVRDMLTETRTLDVVIDGADEVDSCLRLIKGGGGALLHEGVVGQSGRHYVVVTDWRKDSDVLGRTFTSGVPIEVQPLTWQRVKNHIERLFRITASLRYIQDVNHKEHTPYVTDNGNYLLDAKFTEEQLLRATAILSELKAISGVCAVGLFPHMTTVSYFGNAKGKVAKRTRVTTSDAEMLVDANRQQQALSKVIDVVKHYADKSEKRPVVELDLDLTTLMPYRRTIAGIMAAAEDYNIAELKQLVQEKIAVLPGYTAEAWNQWLSLEDVKKITQRYPLLPWVASNEHKDLKPGEEGATVHSSFHRRFWQDAIEMADDIPTEGLANFERRVTAAGGLLVFVSGRWQADMIEATYASLRRAGLKESINLVIGNPGHDSSSGEKISDAQAKVLMQKKIISEYGLPVAYIDDRIDNLEKVAAAVLKQYGVKKFVPVISCVPGYSAAPTYKQHEVNAISNFFTERKNPQTTSISKLSMSSESAHLNATRDDEGNEASE